MLLLLLLCSRQQSGHLLYYMALWLPIALPGFCITCRNSHSSGFFFFQRGFSSSCVHCNAYIYCTVCARNSQRVVKGSQHTFWSDSIASSFKKCNLFAWKISPEWKHFVVSINVPPPIRSSGEGNILNYVSITWVYLANRWLALD